MRVAALIARLAGIALLTLPALPALADKFMLDPTEPPLQLCTGVQKNVRFMHNVWDNGARDTFAQMKAYINEQLTGKGEGEAKLLKIYNEMITRIEAGDYSEPKMIHGEGQIAARNNAGTLCLTAFPTTETVGKRSPIANPVSRD
jgi:hypothetical protein